MVRVRGSPVKRGTWQRPLPRTDVHNPRYNRWYCTAARPTSPGGSSRTAMRPSRAEAAASTSYRLPSAFGGGLEGERLPRTGAGRGTTASARRRRRGAKWRAWRGPPGAPPRPPCGRSPAERLENLVHPALAVGARARESNVPALGRLTSPSGGARRLRQGRCEGGLCVLAFEHTFDTPIWNDPHDGCQDID